MKKLDTSWQKAGKGYNEVVGDRGHYYHEQVVLPGVLRLLGLRPGDSVLDIGCGQGVLARRFPKNISYVGIDKAPFLIAQARKLTKNTHHQFIEADATMSLQTRLSRPPEGFSHIAIVLALQNMEHPENVIENAATYIKEKGTLVMVLNHPAFRIPRQSSWGMDEKNKLQYRQISRYMSPLKIPINMNPGRDHSPMTWSFHRPLSHYSTMLQKYGFVIELIEEWTSDKESQGKAAKMENRGRAEFPLFMAIKARKISLS